MKVSVPIAISARHIHLTKETYEMLFDEELTVKAPINQIGQFAANQTVTLKTPKAEFENVRIVGPFRSYNQVEISKSEARTLGLNPPVRTSGDLDGAEAITIKTPKGEITLNCVIIADRHVHIEPDRAKELGVKDGDVLKLAIGGEKPGVIYLNARVNSGCFYEVHLDTDDANAFLIGKDMEGILFK